jgi:ATP-dependent DNA helicase RecG
MPLPINIHDLIAGRVVESDRIEYKKGWNPGAIYRSICAFANDFDDIGGGYIIIGVDEINGRPVLPVHGVDEDQIDAIQKEMIGYNNLINPSYHPRISIETINNKKIIIIWVLSGANRPYEVPDEIKSKEKKYNYYIRIMSNSVKANKEQREELISLANRIPFDDRPNVSASIKDISPVLLKDHLRKIDSRLLEWVDTRDTDEVLSQMELLSGPSESRHPRNVALMMFTDDPQKYFPQSKVEIVNFPNGAGDPEFFEIPNITGPVPLQITQTLSYLKTNILKEKIKKIPGQAQSLRVANYPYQALEEIIANALYHRDYQTREPVEVRIYPDEIVILNYGGPDRSIKESAFRTGKILPRRYRNRRLGDFLKELDLTEGKATGIPMIKSVLSKNGSPEAQFETDDDRSFFQVTLRIHPEFINEGDIVKSSDLKDYSETIEDNPVIKGAKEKVNEGANQGEDGKESFKRDVKEATEGKAIANGGAKEKVNEGANQGEDGKESFKRDVKEAAGGKGIANEGANQGEDRKGSFKRDVKEATEGKAIANEGATEKLNENKKERLSKDKIESSIYKDLIEGEVEDLTSRTIDKLVRVLKAIAANQYQRVPDYSRVTGIPLKSFERYVKVLKNIGLIDFSESSTKTGGYFLTEKLTKKLEKHP